MAAARGCWIDERGFLEQLDPPRLLDAPVALLELRCLPTERPFDRGAARMA